MPTVEVDPDELRRLTGREDKADEELRADLFALGLEYEGRTEAGEFELEFAPDRLDRLSVEGVARSLRYHYGDDRGVYLPTTNDAEWTIQVEDVPPQRPYVTGAVARGVNLDETVLESVIQLQEKLHATMGRRRAKGAIGIHDLAMLKGAPAREGAGKSVTYTGIAPDGDTFVPLDSDEEMTPADVLERHQVGGTYADLVADYDSMPAIYDEIGLFSFPPVINGRRTEVEADSRDLFVEMTGTDQWTVDKMLTIVCYALDARGARIEDVRVEYPEGEVYDDERVGRVAPGADLLRPDLATKEKRVSHDRIESMLGVDLSAADVVDLAERSGLDAEEGTAGDDEVVYDVTVPPYRVDVLHPLDVIDDLGRAYGFNELAPRYPDVSTVGGRHERSRLAEAVRTQLVGLGFEDMLNFHLVGVADNYGRMGLAVPDALGDDDAGTRRVDDLDERVGETPADAVGAGEAADILNPYSEEYAVVRTWALPSLLLVLENNTHRRYPQDLAEVGFVARVDDSENTGLAESRSVAAVQARTDASYEDARGALQALSRVHGVDLATPPTDHPTFIDGRAADVVMDSEPVGVVGEVHPAILIEHDLEVPVAAFEFDLAALRD